MPIPSLALASTASWASMPMISSISCMTRSGVGRGQVDLVDDRKDFQVLVQGQVDVGKGLRLDPLGGVHHQQRPLAGRQGAGHFVGEIHVAGGIDQIEDVVLAVVGTCSSAGRSGP